MQNIFPLRLHRKANKTTNERLTLRYEINH